VKTVVGNLSRQHRDLMKVATRLMGCLDPQRLVADPHAARRALLELSGTLQVHLAMEDRSFYPKLVQHSDETLRALANRYLETRGNLQEEFTAYRDRWTGAAIADAPDQFIAESQAMLGTLWTRMNEEDRELHPLVIAHDDEG